MVVGAKGRCGNGALTLLQKIGVHPTSWDYEETKAGGPFKEIANHDIFINTALITKKIPPFVTEETLLDGALSIICDVSCDPTGDLNPIPLYDRVGSWHQPLQSKILAGKVRHILAVDNLPSLLPLESSQDFSEQLLPHLRNFATDNNSEVWKQSLQYFNTYCERI
jgi:saccharopine dehydrogenase (NAD+, L-lysine-forming)